MITIEENTLLEMSKLISQLADKSLGDIGKFIYFSPSLDAHGPRIKFYGGTSETSSTRNAPSMKFDTNGNTEVAVVQWMNKKNCPNAFDKEYIAKVDNFVKKTYPVLLLVWFEKLDEAWALEYFKGNISLIELMNHLEIDEDIIDNFFTVDNINDLDVLCKNYNLYKFN
jgi:hypothetical protein